MPVFLRPRQAAVFDAVRLVGVVAEAAFAVGLVFAVIAVEILDMAVAFERQNVRRDAIEEPAVMAILRRRSRQSFREPPRAHASC